MKKKNEIDTEIDQDIIINTSMYACINSIKKSYLVSHIFIVKYAEHDSANAN